MNIEADRCALFGLQLELDERGLRHQVEPVDFDVGARDGDSFDSLIDCLRADSLNLDLALVT